ncbi:uncharacterized protein LOC132713207 [Ruditapes philippinarum]|uniref:uncharacterized protein LOC132713207 n=1 Tax=Ruditapes philippinarum TaxID=129788 RepID=UPI00295AC9E8|nr:uncharacterized protein LOC132713207 [Ruditapes philippinarum]
MFGETTEKLSVKSRRFFWVALILTIIGLLLTIIGVCMPFWTSITDFAHSGVFQACIWTFKSCSSTQDLELVYKEANFMHLLWGLTLPGMFFLLLSIVLMAAYPIHKTVDYCKIAIGIFVLVFLGIGVILILIALIVYVDFSVWNGLNIKDAFDIIGWAWYLTLVGLIILVAGFICFILHMFFMMYEEVGTTEPVSTHQHYSEGDYFSRSKKY